MDIDGAERCPRCFSLWDEVTCPSCGYNAAKNRDTSSCCLAQETILQGRYLIGSVLGAGGFGITYAAWDLKLDMHVAIKEYFPTGLATRDISATDEVYTQPGEEDAHAFAAGLNRFIRESRILALFNTHADVVAVRDCIEENNTAYIIMEYLHGRNLQAYASTFEGRIPVKELMPMMRAPIEALAKIHEMRMLHRDVSPANLILQPNGRVKLIDFGAAMDYVQAGAGQNATMILNRRYAAPEQSQPNRALGPWTDVYGICATLYTLLTAKTPWEASGGDPRNLPPLRAQGVNITRRQERAILRGLTENPKERIQSIPELLSPLYGVPLPEELRRRRRLARITIGAVSATLLISLTVLVNALWGFPGGDGAHYRLEPGGASLIRYGGDAAVFSNRDRFLGVPVTTISSMAFHDNEKLTQINIGQNVLRVEAFAFAGCNNLRTVWLPEQAALMDGVFDRCDERLTLYGAAGSQTHLYANSEGLRFCDPSLFLARVENGEATLTGLTGQTKDFYNEMVVPSTLSGAPVTDIDTHAVFPATRLVLPDTVRRIETDVFREDRDLEEVILPDGLEFIGPSAFNDSLIRSLVIPDSVTSIGERAFYVCYDMTHIQLPASLTYLGPEAFARCGNLTEIHLPDGLSVIEEGTFESCERLTKITFPSELRSIEKDAFAACWQLTEIILPDKTERIGDEAFYGCHQLSRVIIPASVNLIGKDAFLGCADDLTIYGFAGSAAEAYARENSVHFVDMGRWTPAKAFTYNISGNGVSITAYAGGFVDVVVPDYIEGVAVTNLVNELFYDDTMLRSVVLPRMVTVLPRGVFGGCESLTSVELPEGLRVIQYYAFIDCTSLSTLALPSTVSEINLYAFDYCSSLEALTIPGGDILLDGEFWENNALRSVTFQEGVRQIDEWMASLESLEEVVLPESVEYIAPGAFEDCPDTLVIRGVKGSYAETWARQNGITFEEIR